MVKTSRRICFLTGTRAEFGLLRGLITRLDEDPQVDLQLVVTGTHLSPDFGETVNEIEESGLSITTKVALDPETDSTVDASKALGKGIIDLAVVFEMLSPDILVLLGDRLEILAAASAALPMKIPVAHIHGGELTEGAIDDSIRHAVTKMAHLHFPAAEPYRRRILQMGESPENVILAGSLGNEAIAETGIATRQEVFDRLGFPDDGEPLFVITYHAETLGQFPPAEAFEEVLSALADFPESRIVMTYANNDAGGRAINAMIEEYAKTLSGRVFATQSLGRHMYLSTLDVADAVIGNSSSGLLDAPVMGVPSVNIGDRQKGRLRASCVLDCATDRMEISRAIRQALTPEVQRQADEEKLSGKQKAASEIIHATLMKAPLNAILAKRFCDWPAAEENER